MLRFNVDATTPDLKDQLDGVNGLRNHVDTRKTINVENCGLMVDLDELVRLTHMKLDGKMITMLSIFF